ncbi:E3 ubiquitin-protein ligase UHRF2-like [Cloeon dipterum]|uniref:E3 ubiquitin-protein ligase UHRF2-like n=1 Tax=Cloeon dipterum TaxID=197152 RepID=UPI00321FEC77
MEGDWISLRKPCDRCLGNPKTNCQLCSCEKCGVKGDDKPQISCQNCNNTCHLTCANSGPNLWFCTGCLLDEEFGAIFSKEDTSKKPKPLKTAVPPVGQADVVTGVEPSEGPSVSNRQHVSLFEYM